MVVVYIRWPGDEEILKESVRDFEVCTNEALIEAYNKQSKCGICGVHAQTLYLIALRHVILNRFGESPIAMKDYAIEIGDQIELSGKTFKYVDKATQNTYPVEPLKEIKKREFLEPLIIEKAMFSPSISCDAINGLIEIKWRAGEIRTFERVEKWLNDFAEMPAKPIIVNVQLDWIGCKRGLMIFFNALKRIYSKNNQLVVNWYYYEDHEEMLELGEKFSRYCNIPFKMIICLFD